ncbi:MAG: sensor histidine kinase [Myxococcaceae bacterium]
MLAGEMSSDASIVRSTTRALLEPRRLVPILVVCAPLVGAQASFSRDPLAIPLGVAMCGMFVLIAPVSYRVLFPDGLDFRHGAIRVLLYATIGAGVVLSVGAAVPKILDMGATFLTARSSLAVCTAMFLVGGWGLGRDIGFEETLARAKARAAVLEREAELAQLLALRAHLDPHFLFNTLNAIAEWCREDGAVAEAAVLQLSSILRTVLSGVRASSWPLQKELELVRTLFSLHLLRDPALFTLVEGQGRQVNAEVPPLILLPLAENAVKHGPGAGHRGELTLLVQPTPEGVCVVIENPGAYRGPRPGSEGLPTVMKRLELAYGGKATLHIGEAPGAPGRTRVELTLPASGPLPGVMT